MGRHRDDSGGGDARDSGSPRLAATIRSEACVYNTVVIERRTITRTDQVEQPTAAKRLVVEWPAFPDT
jgi:hypothetical protein